MQTRECDILSHSYIQCTHTHTHTHDRQVIKSGQKWSKFSSKTVYKLRREKKSERDYWKDHLMT
jgi:hypothetical protein